MSQAREVKNRINNIKDVRQITKAMNAIAMAKLTQIRQRLRDARDYQDQIKKTLSLLGTPEGEDGGPLINPPQDNGVGVIVLNSDRGLCGRYKEELNRSTRDFILSQEAPVTLIAGGEKSEIYFRNWEEMEKSWTNFYTEPDYAKAVTIAEHLLDMFASEVFSTCWIVYMEFITELNQQLRVEKILPLEIPHDSGEYDPRDFIFEPKLDEMRSRLLKSYLKEKIFWILLQTKASEHAIRRRAMRDATENADELIDDLTLKYNKARQQQITREIADIMGGAEALRRSGS